ncbi:MAG: MBL fold metallo-hydrolase [Deltaproteobacteria bacterium]|nr:MBL fold metallo-hydrolase [Deltaproteobacteria bacterium]
MRFGKFELISLSDGIMRVDGGAMFGVVPRVFWEKTNQPDEKNRISIGVNPLLIKADGCNILVDTGNGDKFSEKLLKIYGIERDTALLESLSDAGLRPEGIDIVINTHLHFDHCGGNTFVDKSGKLQPTFPNARYIVQKAEWEDATNTNELTKASYLPENYMPLMDAGYVDILDGNIELFPGVTVVMTPGHNRGHQSVKIESEGKTAFFLGDMIPTAAHIPLSYIMGYDLYPLELLEVKRKILREALEGDWLMIFEHDPETRMGYLKEANGKLTIIPSLSSNKADKY